MVDENFRLKATLLEQKADDVIEVDGRLYHLDVVGVKGLLGGFIMNQGKTEYDERLFKDSVRKAIKNYITQYGSHPKNYSITIEGEL